MGQKKLKPTHDIDYSKKFRLLNGQHPFKEQLPEQCVEYRARTRKSGKVLVFNFALAKEMGLIPKDHPHQMNSELEAEILKTFSLVIINEYDQIHGLKFPEEEIRPHTYMATRYLQLQHPNKQGKTSGDGRSIWNGRIKNQGKTWDVSSSGTGATQLSPATHLQKKFFKTGDPTISYGCGYSEVEEGLSTLFFSEVLNLNGHDTERVLAIIEYSKGISINVRAHPNLLRPSHFFGPLKQSNHAVLNNMFAYYMNLKSTDSNWHDLPKNKKHQYDYFLKKQTTIFAEMAAKFESDYIFCWLDWDGDNILMDGGIVDYGSIRQFGLFHHEYRFDDVERFSTNIKEQKSKAKYIVQTFCQLIDFIKTGQKKGLDEFSSSPYLSLFDDCFENKKKELLLIKIGFSLDEAQYLMSAQNKIISEFIKAYQYFERAKSSLGPEEVEDGINWNAIFCMRDILRELPQLMSLTGLKPIPDEDFINIIKSSYATPEDLKLTSYKRSKIKDFQVTYIKLINSLTSYYKSSNQSFDLDKELLKITMRSSIINKYDRVTGDSITTIVHEMMNKKPKMKPDDYDKVLSDFIDYQNLNPSLVTNKKRRYGNESYRSKFSRKVFEIVRDYREGL